MCSKDGVVYLTSKLHNYLVVHIYIYIQGNMICTFGFGRPIYGIHFCAWNRINMADSPL